ncbi:AT-hook motif nuclear-localized protein 1 [Morus notabilis]|uniref:AT-hook motif nuclear-localized protein 1 n=1 Tax=Morus notabilis TaxID=981085 RepID=UPI000CED7F6F|nr:AT-hook motif nuclear-localized protein 1 [Morus notabilis]
MEEKEITVYASPVNSETDSPRAISNAAAAVPQAVSAAVGLGNAGMAALATTSFSAAGSGTPGNVDSLGKKKRGRPRKYDADGNLRLSYARVTPPVVQQPGTTPFSLSPASPSEFSSSSSSKRGRGRPPGSGNWQLLASLGELFAATACGDFTPHVVTVASGEDVAGKILSFAQKGLRGVCVLSANGAVSNVTIRQPGSSGGILTYEGRFEILSLSGSFTVIDDAVRTRIGGLSVSLAGPDGRVIGGGIAGLLTAASPIQIVVGSFMPNGYKVHKRKHHREHALASPPTSAALDTPAVATPILQAKRDAIEPGLTPIPPVLPAQTQVEPERNTTADKENQNGASHFAGWNGSKARPDHGQSPDINVSFSGE